MSKDRINIPTTWLAEKAAHYRDLQRLAKDSVDYADIWQMAWAFEFVLEEFWKPSPLIQKMHELSVSDGITPETATLLKMAIEAQETGKMPALPISLQPMPTVP
jgi:hypothetical protein